MPAPEPTHSTSPKHASLHDERRQAERGRQIRGLLLLALAVMLFGFLRADRHVIFPPGWWRLW